MFLQLHNNVDNAVGKETNLYPAHCIEPKVVSFASLRWKGILADHRSHAAESSQKLQIKSCMGNRTKHFFAPPRINGIFGGSPLPSCIELQAVLDDVLNRKKNQAFFAPQDILENHQPDSIGETRQLVHAHSKLWPLHMANWAVKYFVLAKTGDRTTLLRLHTHTTTFQNFLCAGERLHISRYYNNAFLTFSSSNTDSRHLLIKFGNICTLPELQKGISEVLAIATSWHVEGVISALETKIIYAIQKFVLAATAWNIFDHHRTDPCLKWAIICFLKLGHKSCFTRPGAYLWIHRRVLHVQKRVLDTESV